MQGVKKVGGIQGLMNKNLEKYCEDLLKVLKRSLKLTFLSLDLGNQGMAKFLEALPMMNHQFLEELCLTGNGILHESGWGNFFIDLDFIVSPNILEYLEKCTKLKVLRFEIKPKVNEEDPEVVSYPYLSWINETITQFDQRGS